MCLLLHTGPNVIVFYIYTPNVCYGWREVFKGGTGNFQRPAFNYLILKDHFSTEMNDMLG